MRHTAIALGLLFSMADSVQAGFIGQQLDATYYLPDTSTPYAGASFAPPSFVVGAGTETVGDVDGVTDLFVDFENSMLTVMLNTVLGNPSWNLAAFNGILFSLLSPGSLDIAAASIDAATTMPGFDASRVTFSGTTLGVDWNGLSYTSGDIVKINFEFRSVPEPGTLALAGMALLGLGLARGRKG